MEGNVLITDDDPAICRLLEKVVMSNGLTPMVAHSGKEALQLIREHQFSVILMDVMLGDMEGFEVIKKIRDREITTPVMIISGRDEDYDSVYGLSIGADDYITKPFRPIVLGAKIKALIRRSEGGDSSAKDIIHCGIFSYNTTTMRFYKNEEELVLSAKESALMLLFMKHPQQVFTKEMIYETVWGTSGVVDDNTIMVYINRLRKKIEDRHTNQPHIQTVRGIGYRFVP